MSFIQSLICRTNVETLVMISVSKDVEYSFKIVTEALFELKIINRIQYCMENNLSLQII